LIGFDGKRLTLTGDSPWSLMVKVNLDDVRQYLEIRRAQGFNALLVNLIEHHFGGPPNIYGEPPFVGRAFAMPNDAYFDDAHRVIELAREFGFIVFLTPAYVGYVCEDQGWCAEMRAATDAELYAYGRYVGQRFADLPNIIWVHGGDVDVRPYGLESKVANLAAGIRSAASQLHTAHCARDFSALDCYSFLRLDLDAAYGGCPTVAAAIRHSARASALPFVLIEGRYEDEGADLECVRRQAFAALLGGAVGQFYGQHVVQFFDEGWRGKMDTPGAQAVTKVARVLNDLDLLGGKPDTAWPYSAGAKLEGDMFRSKIVTGFANGRLAAFTGGATAVSVAPPPGPAPSAALWYDLDSGRSKIVPLERPTFGAFRVRPPYASSWLLVVPAQRPETP
jgi:hypothetical protein